MRKVGINHFIMWLLNKVEMKTQYEFEQDEIDKLDPNMMLNSQAATSRCENNSQY